MADTLLRPAAAADFDAILRLNDEWVHHTSPLDREALQRLHDLSPFHVVAERDGRVVAFLLALREATDYASPNYRWFERRGGVFLYVDRVIVDMGAQGGGLARRLYQDLFSFARASGVNRIVCELDIEPPNLPSARLHDSLGFREVGQQVLPGGTKRVSLREIELV